jgi:hypothetical protein
MVYAFSDGGAWLWFPNREEDAMISLHDCIGLCGLTEAEVLAIAEHEHVPEIVATALGHDLLGQSEGCRRIGAMIADDVSMAISRGDRRHAEVLRATLQGFVATHPEALASVRARACLNGWAKDVA